MNLENNSNEMKTVVETFVIEETAELIYDNDKLDKWNELVKDLGLTGQTKIQSPEKSPIPFMHLKVTLKNVFEQLCPRKVKIENYDVTPIPVEILDLVGLSKRENYFQSIEIWYDDKSPDPACIGVTSEFYVYNQYVNIEGVAGKNYPNKQKAIEAILSVDPSFDTNKTIGWEANLKHYLLGKWADVKHSFEELKQMAQKRYIQEKGNDLRKKIKEAERELIDLETKAFDLFNASSSNELIPF